MNIPIETVRTVGFEMRYFKFGGGKKNMVILPGLSVQSVTLSAGAIENAYKTMKDDFTVYVFDRRTCVPARYTIAQMASDTLEAIDTIGLSGLYLFGASQGGMIAMEIAAARPELVRKLALGSTAPRIGPCGKKTISRWAELARSGESEKLFLEFGQAVYPARIFEPMRGLFADWSKGVTQDELDRFAVLCEGTEGFDVYERLKNITCPVLAVGAEDDAIFGAQGAEDIAAAFAGKDNCKVFIYGGGFGHAAYDTAPDYKKRLSEFFNE